MECKNCKAGALASERGEDLRVGDRVICNHCGSEYEVIKGYFEGELSTAQTEQAIEIFERKYTVWFDFTLNEAIKSMRDMLDKVGSPAILCYTGPDVLNFYPKPNFEFIGTDAAMWIARQYGSTGWIGDKLLEISTEDVAWTEERNKGLTGTYYRQITLIPEAQDVIRTHLREKISEAELIKSKMQHTEQIISAEREKRRAEGRIVKEYKKVLPRGGECGVDGYREVDLEVGGEVIRMVDRDVFDFGCYSYPKRVEGTDGVFKRDEWTDAERRAGEWLSEFGFRGIRM